MFSQALLRRLLAREPFLWLNQPSFLRGECAAQVPDGRALVFEAAERLQGFAALLLQLFPELAPSGGVIESPLYHAPALQRRLLYAHPTPGRWLLKADHELPVTGSIKARGGVYEVLLHAEALALRAGLIQAGGDILQLASPQARHLFAGHTVAVGSTGNLGLSIGVVAAALGFQAVVHMSADAKLWKKERLRARGVRVIEHAGDYGEAVAEGRRQAERDPRVYFVDDEKSIHLFLGYSVAAVRLRQQLADLAVTVDAEHPLFVYLPCGVGGAPGGITFGLHHLFGKHVHCFFAEPVASPCVLLGLASGGQHPLTVRDVGLDNRTEADGLAVGKASELVLSFAGSLIAGVFTVTDADLFQDLYILEQTMSLRVEPSAAAGMRGPQWLLSSRTGRHYLSSHGLVDHLDNATHVIWTTGGSFVPDDEYRKFYERGRMAHAARDV